MTAPISAVIDTNLIISAFLSPRGAPRALLLALYAERVQLVCSASLRDEYAEVLARPHLIQRFNLSPDEIATFMRFLDRRASFIVPTKPYRALVRDPKDDHVIATALDGDANYLITGDADLLALANDPRIGTDRKSVV